MTITLQRSRRASEGGAGERFRLHRAGILNVWQYDDQEFLFADGRLLLRGANGAGKSKTLEMLLPFALDGDKARITASARHHTSLLWLMTDGYDGQARVGYVWVEFLRTDASGAEEAFTCGVGIRASVSGRTATAWHFVSSQRIGRDLALEDEAGPLSRARLEEAIGPHGQVFDRAAPYKEHVGQALFGLPVAQYDEVLRLLYWLRQPQVGEDIEPARLADQLAQALPQLHEHAVKAAGDTFDELAEHGQQLERRAAAARSLAALAAAYSRYSRAVVAERGRAVVAAVREERRLRSALRRHEQVLAEVAAEETDAKAALEGERRGAAEDRSRIEELAASPEADARRRLEELTTLVGRLDELAQQAGRRAERSEKLLAKRADRHAATGDELLERARRHADRLRELGRRLREAAVACPLPVPAALAPAALDDPAVAAALGGALEATTSALDAAGRAVGSRQAEVRVLATAVDEWAEARRDVATAEREAEQAGIRHERAQQRRASVEADAATEEDRLRERLASWAAQEPELVVPLPDALDDEALAALPDAARRAVDPLLERLRRDAQAAAVVRDTAAERIEELEGKRAEAVAERDPAPPAPALPRTPRLDGAPLWRLVDFAEHVEPGGHAPIEAALQAAGLLDAWVRPDGAVLAADAQDVCLPAGPAVDGPSLADALRPDLAAETDISEAVVTGVLRRIRLLDTVTGADGAAVGRDGTWSLAPLHGRAAKDEAQYVGATARARERQRRIEQIDRDLAQVRSLRDEAAQRYDGLHERLGRLVSWLRQLPAADAVRAAWAVLEERRATEREEESAHEAAQAQVQRARQVAAERRRLVDELAARHGLPGDADALRAVGERLSAVARDLTDCGNTVPVILRDVDRWHSSHAELAEATAEAEADTAAAEASAGDAATKQAALTELRQSVGATVQELERRLAAVRGSLAAHEIAIERGEDRLRQLANRHGEAKGAVRGAHEAVVEHGAVRAAVLADLAALTDVPGLLEATLPTATAEAAEHADLDPALLMAARTVPGDQPVRQELVAAADALAARAAEGEAVDQTIVWQAYNEASTGPAADHEPAISTTAGVLCVTGRDEAGEVPIGRLAARVAAAVARDRELLTEHERQRFEQHVLGELGDAIRQRRTEAQELVDAMNEQLGKVTTSQGIRVRLDWRLRDDVPADAREALELLGQPKSALLPEERATLRDALHRLIEASRSEAPELSYGEHLANALDYRSWFRFRIRYTRPEAEGQWLELHRRSGLSQGEQKVLCYLPLFAAAAAHFTSLAGAAPYAPRLVLLDDAFPKIDVRTHPLLFGLLVQLDLDFVITSERLWGDHETVPSLAIYEALRDPSQRGIAQYEYRWDGRQLRALG